ncbi:MAG: YdcF family protein [Clostridia bacterium]|nr:YdcF family protein [Clostridia bacterium]
MLQWMKDIADFIFLADDPVLADIIFVPGNGHALPSELAARLYRSSYAPYILPSGRYAIGTNGFAGQKSGARRYEGKFETEWAFMRHILLENGVPESAILREDEATYTYQNAIYSRKRTDAEKLVISRAIICCMPVHARRSRMYYETLYPDAELLVCPAPGAAITRDNWLQSAEGIDTVLGEVERCGGQFHDILKDLAL